MPQTGSPPADVARHEMGVRVRAFERAFQRRLSDPAARRAVLPHLQQAVAGFFTGRTGQVGQALDAARAAVEGEPDAARRWADGLALWPERWLTDAPGPAVMLTVAAFAPSAETVPPGASWEIDGQTLPLTALPARAEVPAGRARVWVRIRVGGRVVLERRLTLARVSDLERRLDRLAAAAGDDAAGRTARDTAAFLRSVRDGAQPENDPDLADLLRRAEVWAPSAPGDHRLVLDAGSRGTPCRLFVPSGRGPFPLVVALHGAGGSENLFFDGYGAGRLVDLCRKRRWLMAAPRTGSAPADAVAEAVGRLVPVDLRRCWLVGHSMGAAAGVAAVDRAPGRFAAAAFLGGGGFARAPQAWRDLPVLVGAGSADFGRAGAEALARTLRDLGARAELRLYSDTEHLGVVQIALDDVVNHFAHAPELSR